MTYLGDTLTISLLLVLVFGSLALYLYTRIQQTEQKVSLLESIVLDLKLTGELPVFGEFPSSSPSSASPLSAPSSSPPASSLPASSPLSPSSLPASSPEYTPFIEEVEEVEEVVHHTNEKEQEQEAISFHPLPEESPYDHMTLKELQGVVRARGLPSEKGAKKQALIELLKRSDQVQQSEVKPSSPPSSSFLESSSPLSEDASLAL